MDKVFKQGVVTKIVENKVWVAFDSCSGCQNCQMNKFCTETKQKEVVVEVDEQDHFQIGEKVVVISEVKEGLKAVVLGYLLPLVLMVGCVLVMSAAGYEDNISGISGIIVLIPYYFGVFLLKDRLKSAFTVRVEHLNSF